MVSDGLSHILITSDDKQKNNGFIGSSKMRKYQMNKLQTQLVFCLV
jgi:hypothetical protein